MNQMASLFGSVAIDGKRMPLCISGKSLPSFKPYEVNPLAGGYIPDRFMTGINPQSYFFLCVVGRDVSVLEPKGVWDLRLLEAQECIWPCLYFFPCVVG